MKDLTTEHNIDVRVAYSNKGIDNVEELVKQDTFRSCGKGWIDCRDKILSNNVIEFKNGIVHLPSHDNGLYQ